MELKKAIDLLKKDIFFLLLFAILGAIIGWQAAKFLPQGYTQSQLFFVAKAPLASPSFYNFEGYYTQETARNFTDTAVAILENRQFQNLAQESNATANIRKVAPQLINITTQSSQKENLEGLIPKLAVAFNTQIANLTKDDLPIQIKEVAPASNITYFALNPIVLSIAGIILGTTFSVFIVALKIYFKV